MTADEIAGHPALFDLICRQSQALLRASEENPRLSAVFATQQRWLMGHVGLALYFRRGPQADSDGMSTARFFEVIDTHSVASRNMANAFVKEMLNYGFASHGAEAKDRRTRLIRPTPASLQAIYGWTVVHLATLDGLDGGSRLVTFYAASDGLSRIQPLICDGLLTSSAVRKPQSTFSLFTWLNEGGIVMERLISGMRSADAHAERISTDITSITKLGMWLNLSRAHLARTLREAEEIGSIGWRGKRGRSVMWVSNGFFQEYMTAQAVKLAIIDASFQTCFGLDASHSIEQLGVRLG